MSVLTILWSNRVLIGKIAAGVFVLFVAWWFFIHNPKVIKQLEAEKAEAIRQVKVAHETINLLGNIERKHDVITKISYKNISSIRYSPRPAVTGLFVPGGMLQTVP